MAAAARCRVAAILCIERPTEPGSDVRLWLRLAGATAAGWMADRLGRVPATPSVIGLPTLRQFPGSNGDISHGARLILSTTMSGSV